MAQKKSVNSVKKSTKNSAVSSAQNSLKKKCKKVQNDAQKISLQKSSKKNAKTKKKYFLLLRIIFAIGRFFRRIWQRTTRRARNFLARRPHRSFYLTKKTDARRPWRIRGYFSFQSEVWHLVWKNRGVLFRFLLLYFVLVIVLGALLSQGTFASLRENLDKIDSDLFTRWATLFSSAITIFGDGFLKNTLAVLLLLYSWLSLIWLFRNFSKGKKVCLRDGLYSGGAPVVAMAVIVAVVLVQLLPFALGLIVYTSVNSVGWINSGIQIENMAAWCALAALAVLTLFWMTSSFIAMIVVTLPGIYPFRALKIAGDMVTSRRLRILFRLIFMMLPIIFLWAIFLSLAIVLDGIFKFSWQPLVPVSIAILSGMTLIWCAAYIYTLYRRLLDDPAPPAKIRPKKKNNLSKTKSKKSRIYSGEK